MEGNFLSRYNKRIDEWMQKINDNPPDKSIYEGEMSDYIARCMPYIQQYIENDKPVEINTNNVFI